MSVFLFLRLYCQVCVIWGPDESPHLFIIFLFIYLFFFYVLAYSAGRLSSKAWWSALARRGAGNFVYSGTSYVWLMLPPETRS